MRTMEGENELLLTCRTAADGVEILRCETRDAVVRLPNEIDGAPVISLGPYALAERAPDLDAASTFSVRVTCGGPPPVHDANAVRSVFLPTPLKHVGSYAFFNCRKLDTLSLSDAVRDFDGGALMNCRALHRVRIAAAEGTPTCLQKLLGETAGEIDVTLAYGAAEARLLFPEYAEELEDLSPAHIFQRRIHGAGYAYRQCFSDSVLQFPQYDRALPELLERHDFAIAARLAARRLARPYALGDAARDAYLACLRAHSGPLACRLAETGDGSALAFLLSLHVLSRAEIDAACDKARANGRTEALSVLLAATRQTGGAARRKTFDL